MGNEPHHLNESELGNSTYCSAALSGRILATSEQMCIKSLDDAPWRLGHARFKTGDFP
jgi:hypothetical protein